MIFLIRFFVLGLWMISFFIIGCGDKSVEDILDPVFVMDRAEKKTSTVQLNEDNDKEESVIAELNSLKDIDINLEVKNAPETFKKALRYVSKVISRSNLLPVEKRSHCQCQYASSTFKLAIEVYGQLLISLKKQDIAKLAESDIKQYQETYEKYEEGIQNLVDITKINELRIAGINDKEISEMKELKKVAQKYVDELRPAKPAPEDKKSDKDKDKEEKSEKPK